ncbi:hypothetical protein BJY52DRAFT_1307884 [Lactarius psammicola]|nr:hypothetical protein BJY52DRAFT_1307884 [Lactarius psammicola]
MRSLRITSTQFNNLQSLFSKAEGGSFELTANAQIGHARSTRSLAEVSGSILVKQHCTPTGSGLDLSPSMLHFP